MTESRNDADEVLDELHQLRVALDERFGHDPEKYFAYIREYERQLLREGWVQAPPPPPEYVARVTEALARVQQNPHLLDFPDESGTADGDASRAQPAEAEDASEAVRQTAGSRQQDRSAA